jgi:hypothetical protein
MRDWIGIQHMHLRTLGVSEGLLDAAGAGWDLVQHLVLEFSSILQHSVSCDCGAGCCGLLRMAMAMSE